MKNNELLKETFDEGEEFRTETYVASEQVINLHRETLRLKNKVQQQSELLSELGDEILSYSGSLSNKIRDAGIKDRITNLEVLLDEVATTALDAIKSKIKVEVLGISSEVNNSFVDAEKIIAYANEAIANEKQNKRVKVNRNKKLIIPPELEEAFNQDNHLKISFQEFSPGKKHKFANYISHATT